MISGYAELLDVRRSGRIPASAVLLTDSEVIEWSWSELLRSHPSITAEQPPCAVLRIKNEQPHDLPALRGLPVLCMLVRESSQTWLERARSARPSDLVPMLGPDAYVASARISDAFLDEWLGDQ